MPERGFFWSPPEPQRGLLNWHLAVVCVPVTFGACFNNSRCLGDVLLATGKRISVRHMLSRCVCSFGLHIVFRFASLLAFVACPAIGFVRQDFARSGGRRDLHGSGQLVATSHTTHHPDDGIRTSDLGHDLICFINPLSHYSANLNLNAVCMPRLILRRRSAQTMSNVR